MAPANPVTKAPAAWAASRRLGTSPNPRAAETGMVAYPASFHRDGDFRTCLTMADTEGPSVSSRSSSMPPETSAKRRGARWVARRCTERCRNGDGADRAVVSLWAADPAAFVEVAAAASLHRPPVARVLADDGVVIDGRTTEKPFTPPLFLLMLSANKKAATADDVILIVGRMR
jgi:hypothetical protein